MSYRPPSQRRVKRSDMEYGERYPEGNPGPILTIDGYPTGGHVLAVGVDTRMATEYGIFDVGQVAYSDGKGAIAVIHFTTDQAA